MLGKCSLCRGIELQSPLVQFAPILPVGALAYTALVLFHRASGNTSKARSRQVLFGDRFSSRVNWFGIGAEQMSRQFFAGQVSARQVLARHTLYGFYSLGLSREMASRWGESLAQGHAQRPTQYVRNGVGSMVSESLRWCEDCAAHDQAIHGFSAWRVVHQLPFMRMCPEHGATLYVHCAKCGSALDDGVSLKLPGEPCNHCGSVDFVAETAPSSENYKALMRRCIRAVERQDGIYRPNVWRQVMKTLYARTGSVESAVGFVEASVGRLMACPGHESSLQGDVFGPYLHSKYVRQVVLGHLTASPLIIQMMVLEALERDCLVIRQRVVELESTNSMSRVDAVSLPAGRIDQEQGMSDRFVAMVTASSSLREIAREFGISTCHARSLVDRYKGLSMDDHVHQKRSYALPLVNGSDAEKTELCRSWVLSVLQSQPMIGRTELWKRREPVVTWLAKHDRQWLDEHVPSKYPNRRSVLKR